MTKVLLIDDRRENINFIAENILKPLGYEIGIARNGEAGLTKALDEEPDLIITDIKLPRMTGLEMLEELQRKDVMIPSIVMTFHGSEETAMRALRAGARDYLIKPFTIEEMQKALDRALKPISREIRQIYDGDPEITKLQKELDRLNRALTEREQQLKEATLKVNGHEQEINQLKLTLSDRENQLRQMHQYLANYVKKGKTAEPLENGELAETKGLLGEAQARVELLEEVLSAQQVQLNKYRQETSKLADQLRHISEVMQLMSQKMDRQFTRLATLTSSEKKE